MKKLLLFCFVLLALSARSGAIEEMPLPRIPEEITERADKFRYAALHFWDALDFNDTSKSADEAFMGQNFANFTLFLAGVPDSLSRSTAAAAFLDKASVNAEALARAKSTARQYLSAYDSPMRDNELWINFLDVMLHSPSLSPEESARCEYEYEMEMKNRIGKPAADFEFELREGGLTTLKDTPTGTEGLYILFYNPDCDHCREAIEQMKNSSKLNADIASGRLAVLAIDAEDDRDEWLLSASSLPSNWTVGFNTDGIVDRDVYVLPSMPTLYLLTPDRKVAGKELPIDF